MSMSDTVFLNYVVYRRTYLPHNTTKYVTKQTTEKIFNGITFLKINKYFFDKK